MKRILIALALILSVTTMSAQQAQQAVDKAREAAKDAKKAAKVDTWLKLADELITAYDLPTKSLLPNATQTDVRMFLKGQTARDTKKVNIMDTEYTVETYADKDLYYNSRGALDFWIVTRPAASGDLLGEATAALLKAASLDTKGAKTKDIQAKLESIHSKLDQDARFCYLAGLFDKSAELFKACAAAYDNVVMGKTDNASYYYTALVSNLAGKTDEAISYYQKCIANGYSSDGNAYANLADIYKANGNNDACLKTLEEGFEKNPESQGILIGLINHYRETGSDPSKMFDLIHKAQANEPKNASLFYVEGDIYKEMGEIENAAKMYDKSIEVDPSYVYGFLGKGMLYYDKAVELQTAASEELDDTKWSALMKEMEETLAKGIEPFESAYAKSDDSEIKVAVAEYLKNIYFRLRDKNDSYQGLYEKYNKIVLGE